MFFIQWFVSRSRVSGLERGSMIEQRGDIIASDDFNSVG
jgi:hypothetical protein